MNRLLIVIPAYNEEESIEEVVNNIKENYSQFDYVIVNDGSKDSTYSVCEKNKYNIIDLPINLGLAGGFQAGAKYAYLKGYDCFIQFDADGQHLPEYIDKMLKKLDEGYDIVIGSRFVDEKKHFSMRMLGSRIITAMIKLTTGATINDPTSGMRIINKELIKDYAFELNRKPEPDTLAFQIKKGYKAKEVQVKMEDRLAGTSYLKFARSISYMFRMLMSILFVQNFRKR